MSAGAPNIYGIAGFDPLKGNGLAVWGCSGAFYQYTLSGQYASYADAGTVTTTKTLGFTAENVSSLYNSSNKTITVSSRKCLWCIKY